MCLRPLHCSDECVVLLSSTSPTACALIGLIGPPSWTLQQMNGQLEFYNVDEAETMATGEHFMCTDIEWDPTGRYVATVVTSVHQMENGFNVWAWNGNLLYRCALLSSLDGGG